MKKITSVVVFCLIATYSFGQTTPTNYSLATNWVLNHNLGQRFLINPSYTIVKADTNLRTVVPIPYDTLSNYDVFCVYPTIPTGGGGSPQIHPLAFNSATVTPLVKDLYSQYGKYGRLYAPYYRQVNGVTFTSPGNMLTQAALLDTALADVIGAFEFYFNNYNGGKKIILVGHSQGSVLLGLMLRIFESNPTLYSAYMNKIVLTVLPGFVTGPHTALSSNTGGWFQNYPICQNPNDINCMMTWQTYRNTATLSTTSSSNHIYNDSLYSWGYRYKAFDSINYQILNDPLYYTTTDTIPLTIFPNNMVNYGGITTYYIAYQNYFKAYDQQVASDYGLKVQKIITPLDKRINPFSALFYHIYDHYIASGSIHDLMQLKLSLITGIQNQTMPAYDLTIFPNPSSNGVYEINNGGLKIKSWSIINLMGQVITSGSDNVVKIDTKGFYIISIKTDKGIITRKLIYE